MRLRTFLLVLTFAIIPGQALCQSLLYAPTLWRGGDERIVLGDALFDDLNLQLQDLECGSDVNSENVVEWLQDLENRCPAFLTHPDFPGFASKLAARPAKDESGGSSLDVGATGDVRNVANGESEGATTGSLQLLYFTTLRKRQGTPLPHELAIAASVVIAAADDTISTNFGRRMIEAGTSRFGSRLETITYWEGIGPGKLYAKGYLGAETVTWSVAQSGQKDLDADGLILARGFLLGYEFAKKSEALEGSIRMEIGRSGRLVRGDLSRNASTARRLALKTDRKNLGGWELGLILSFQRITAGAALYFYDNSALGLGGGQMSAGIGISTSLFEIK